MDQLVSSYFLNSAMLVRLLFLFFMLAVLGTLGSTDLVNPLNGQHLRVLAMEV